MFYFEAREDKANQCPSMQRTSWWSFAASHSEISKQKQAVLLPHLWCSPPTLSHLCVSPVKLYLSGLFLLQVSIVLSIFHRVRSLILWPFFLAQMSKPIYACRISIKPFLWRPNLSATSNLQNSCEWQSHPANSDQHQISGARGSI